MWFVLIIALPGGAQPSPRAILKYKSAAPGRYRIVAREASSSRKPIRSSGCLVLRLSLTIAAGNRKLNVRTSLATNEKEVEC